MPKDSAIKLYRSTTANAVPGASTLAAGELAVNLTDKRLYVGDAAGTSYHELTRRAAAYSPITGPANNTIGYLNVQLADNQGMLTGPSFNSVTWQPDLGWDPSSKTLLGYNITAAYDLVCSSFIGTQDNINVWKIIQFTGNPSWVNIINSASDTPIAIGDSVTLAGSGIGLYIDTTNLVSTFSGDLQVQPDINTNTTGALTVAGATTLSADLAVNGGDITTSVTGTASLFNTNCTTLNIGQAATAISIGATTGTTTFRNGIVAPAGTATLAPLKLVSGTNLTTPSAGAIEYDGKCFYATTANGRALVGVEHYAVVTTTRTISNVNTAQAVFDSANDALTLAANTAYAFEGFYRIISGTTSHTTNMGFQEVGVGTLGTWYYLTLCHAAAAASVSRAQDSTVFTSPTVNSTTGAVNSSSASALTTIWFRGVVETSTDAVTVTPQICFSAAPGGTNQIGVGSFIRFTPLGTDTVQSVGPWA